MADNNIEPLFPNMPVVRVAQEPLVIPRRNTEVSRWVEQTLEQERSGRRWAWTIACALILICAAQAAAIALLLPLREVVPYTILVDKQTGYIETARGLDVGALAEDQAVVESMVAQYVLARETFDPADFNERYDRVALWSLGSARDGYVSQYQPNGPDNVLSQMRPGTIVKVMIKKIELLTGETAMVRFETERRDTGADPVRFDWQAIVSYRFTGAPMRMEDRLLNPLGFQVVGYRRDSETAADQVLTPVPAPTQAVPSDSSLAQPPANRANTRRAGAQ
jgi:type IV secretion system protein VirB8